MFTVRSDLDDFAADLRRSEAAFPAGMLLASHGGAELVALEARRRAPRLTGDLVASIRATGPSAQTSLIYAGVQEEGWPGHNIEPQPYMGPAADAAPIEPTYTEMVDRVLRTAFPN